MQAIFLIGAFCWTLNAVIAVIDDDYPPRWLSIASFIFLAVDGFMKYMQAP